MLTLDTNIKPGAIGEKPTTQRAGFDFNSYFKFNGKYIAIMAGGVYELGGTTKNGAAINAYFEPFNSKLGFDGIKRLRFLYLGIDTEGTMKVIVTADGADTRTITVTPQKTGRQYIRVPVGRDVSGCYWNFRIENVAGCRFSLDTLRALPIYLSKGRDTY